jgi:PIN domain nuclease of toxin-antitoxin system
MMQGEYLLDASALLAVLLGEPGQEHVLAILDRSFVHSVNVAEVIARLIRSGVPVKAAKSAVSELHLETEHEFREPALCGEMLAASRELGLSLGDCVCLTTAAMSGAIAVTADRVWSKVNGQRLGGKILQVEVIR